MHHLSILSFDLDAQMDDDTDLKSSNEPIAAISMPTVQDEVAVDAPGSPVRESGETAAAGNNTTIAPTPNTNRNSKRKQTNPISSSSSKKVSSSSSSPLYTLSEEELTSQHALTSDLIK